MIKIEIRVFGEWSITVFFLSLFSLDEGVHVRPNGDESLNSQHRAAQAPQKIERTSVGEFSSALCASDCVKKKLN